MSDLFGNHIVGFPTRWLNYFPAGGIFSPLNENVTGRSSSALSPLAMNSYSPYMEQRNNSGQVPMDYNRINSQVGISLNLFT